MQFRANLWSWTRSWTAKTWTCACPRGCYYSAMNLSLTTSEPGLRTLLNSFPGQCLPCWSWLIQQPWCRLKVPWNERTHGWCMMLFAPTRRCAKQCYPVLWNSRCHLKTTWEEPVNSESKRQIHGDMQHCSCLLCKLVIAAANATFWHTAGELSCVTCGELNLCVISELREAVWCSG